MSTNETRPRVVFIAGLGHSGTTLLDLLLGAHPGVVGLGEVYNMLDPVLREAEMDSYCSCGLHSTECPFWKQAYQAYDPLRDMEANYRALLAVAKKTFGPETIIVDSSVGKVRFLPFLKAETDLKVIFLTRDYRSWLHARHDSTQLPRLWLGLRWWAENLWLRHKLKQFGLSYFGFGYEEMALHTEMVIPKMARFLKIDDHPDLRSPQRSKSHIVSGNIGRMDPEKRRQIIYDSRWLTSASTQFYAGLLGFLQGANRRWVYANILNPKTGEHRVFGHSRKRAFMDG